MKTAPGTSFPWAGYITIVNSKGETFSDESLFMALIFQLQKMINHLIDELSKYDTNMQY